MGSRCLSPSVQMTCKGMLAGFPAATAHSHVPPLMYKAQKSDMGPTHALTYTHQHQTFTQPAVWLQQHCKAAEAQHMIDFFLTKHNATSLM